MKKFIKYLLCASFLLVMFSFCGGTFLQTTSLFSSLPDADGSSNLIPSQEFFYVKISDATYRGIRGNDILDYAMYEKENGPGYDCKIPIDAENTTEDMYCMFEVMEGDLFLHQLEFEYNTPPGMCDYLSFQTHWHYNQKAGPGPDVVCESWVRGSDAQGNTIKIPVFLGRPCPESDPPVRAGADEIKDLCPYIFGEEENHCCLDTYTLEKHEGEAEEQKTSWGGDLKNCIGGLGRTAWEHYTADGFPLTLIQKSGDRGIRGRYEIPAIIEVLDQKQGKGKRNKSFVTANHWIGIEDNSDKPDFYKADPLLSTQLLPEGHPYITWSCEDKAREVKHRIHLIIREWNSQEEFRDFKNGGSGDPDIANKEGSDCDYYEKDDDYLSGEENCNDMHDADDWGASGGGHPDLEYK